MLAYNAGRYVAEAVESILAQTYTDFEFLIIDDGSTDRTLKVLKQYAARDPRIHLVSRPNRGLVATLNEGLALARAEFIARMDADDIALPHRFERQIAYMREHPDIICVGSAVMTMDQAGRDLIESGFPAGPRNNRGALASRLAQPLASDRDDASRGRHGDRRLP